MSFVCLSMWHKGHGVPCCAEAKRSCLAEWRQVQSPARRRGCVALIVRVRVAAFACVASRRAWAQRGRTGHAPCLPCLCVPCFVRSCMSVDPTVVCGLPLVLHVWLLLCAGVVPCCIVCGGQRRRVPATRRPCFRTTTTTRPRRQRLGGDWSENNSQRSAARVDSPALSSPAASCTAPRL